MSWWLWFIIVPIAIFCLVVLRGAPYVPSKRKLLDRAFTKLYPLSDKDTLVDIGSGDGVVLRAAAHRGAKAIGYEINPILVVISRFISRSPLISVRLMDFWYADLPTETTVIYTFGEARDIKKMFEKARSTAIAHQKTIYFISFGFDVPGEKPHRYDGSFYLYKLKPLQRGSA